MIDFGGQPALVSNWTLGQAITPKSGGFALIATANAADIPMSSCESDKPRQSGEVFNLASGKALETHATTDYLPGYNNRVWAQTVNGHLVTISPVSILRDSAAVDRQPFVEVVQNYQTIFDVLGVSDFALLLIFFLFLTTIHLLYVAFKRTRWL